MKINTREEFNNFKTRFTDEKLTIQSVSGTEVLEVELNTGEIVTMPKNCKKWVNSKFQYGNDLIYGADKTKNVVSIEFKQNKVYVYTETPEGVTEEIRPFKPWVMSNVKPSGKHERMDGNLHFKYMKEFDSPKAKQDAIGILQYKLKKDVFTMWDEREGYMVKNGLTYFKGMGVQDVSILSFDIETNKTLDPKLPHSKTLLISNTFRKGGVIVRNLFSLDNYKNEYSMILAWTKWVNKMNPSILIGHNIYSFDLYYLHHRLLITQKTQIGDNSEKFKGLPLGRDNSVMKISKKVSQFRYDGSQSYDYNKTEIFGREIVDTFFLAMKYDVSRDLPSYALKNIIEHLGFEKEGRIKWDFEKDDPAKIWEDLENNKEKWNQYKEYCIDDSDDSLKLFDKMIPAYFYINCNIPVTFQNILLTATGSWINKFLLRGYIGDLHSIPKPNNRDRVYGGISLGVPGIYKNVVKVDVKSMYPSIILEYKIGPRGKDPLNYFIQMVEFFTHKRFEQKDMYVATGDVKYNDLQSASKIFINSAFGALSTAGLHFNDFQMADKITGIGRQIIRKTIKWATGDEVGQYYVGYDYDKDSKYDGIL